MITLIHGEDIATSRNYYLSEKEKHPEKVTLDGAALALTDFLQATSGTGLFGDTPTIFIEELLSKRKASKELDALVDALIKTDAEIFLWESKDLTAKQLSPFAKATIKKFAIPQTVFAFLDSLSPNNGKKSLILFHELLKNEDANFALFMLQRQIRILLAMKDPDAASISEAKRMAPWQKGKIQKQADAFSLDSLLSLHRNLFNLDRGQKTGSLTTSVEQAIDFLLISM